MPTSNATAKSSRLLAPRTNEPTTSNETTGRADAKVVLSERAKTSLVETLAIFANDWRDAANFVEFS